MDKYINKYIPVQKRYLDECSPEEHCDIIVNNQDYLNPIV